LNRLAPVGEHAPRDQAVELAQNLLFEGDRHRHTGHGLVSDMMIGRA
jgi:hypothetical protein